MTGITALPLIAGVVIFLVLRVTAVRRWLEGLSIAGRARALVSGRESSRLREARLASDAAAVTTAATESDVASWLAVTGSFFRWLSMFLLVSGLLCSSAYYMVFVLIPPLAQSRGWSFQEFYVFASAVTGLFVLILLVGVVAIAGLHLRKSRRSRLAPGNLNADALVLKHMEDASASVDAARYPTLARLIASGRRV